MKLFPIVSKPLHMIATAHMILSSKCAFYFSMNSAVLYASYILESRECWVKAVKCEIFGECNDPCLDEPLRILREIPIYGWNEVSGKLKAVARLTTIVYSSVDRSLTDFLKSSLNLPMSLGDIYLIIGFIPSLDGRSLSGLLGITKTEFFIYSFADPFSVTPQALLDSSLSSVIRGVVKIRRPPLPDGVISQVINCLAPEGELSKHLKLVTHTKEQKEEVCNIVKKYFADKLYKSKGLFSYVSEVLFSRANAKG